MSVESGSVLFTEGDNTSLPLLALQDVWNVRSDVTVLNLDGVVILIGGLSLFWLGKGRWSLGESLYMAVISVSTVGFGELPELSQVRFARGITVMTILAGLGSGAFFQSAMTALLINGVIGQTWR